MIWRAASITPSATAASPPSTSVHAMKGFARLGRAGPRPWHWKRSIPDLTLTEALPWKTPATREHKEVRGATLDLAQHPPGRGDPLQRSGPRPTPREAHDGVPGSRRRATRSPAAPRGGLALRPRLRLGTSRAHLLERTPLPLLPTRPRLHGGPGLRDRGRRHPRRRPHRSAFSSDSYVASHALKSRPRRPHPPPGPLRRRPLPGEQPALPAPRSGSRPGPPTALLPDGHLPGEQPPFREAPRQGPRSAAGPSAPCASWPSPPWPLAESLDYRDDPVPRRPPRRSLPRRLLPGPRGGQAPDHPLCRPWLAPAPPRRRSCAKSSGPIPWNGTPGCRRCWPCARASRSSFPRFPRNSSGPISQDDASTSN